MQRLLLLACVSIVAAGQTLPGFRNATWGISQAQVFMSESNPLSEVRESRGEVIVRYDSLKLAGQYQQESKAYLDQDRAALSEILESDRFVGLAVSLGQLKLYSQWAGGRTKVLHGLTGQEHHITHQIEYLRAEFEALENQIQAQRF